MELSLIRTLMDKSFYDDNRGARCPDRLFSADVRMILEQYGDDFLPNLNVEWDDIEIETLLAKADLEARWTFNINSLTRKVEGVNAGHLIEIGARPNTGKTSFHASLIAAPGGFAHQGANCIILCNEEGYHRVGARYLTAADIVLLDMGDKFAKTGGFARMDEALKANAVHARMIAKQHECAVFYMSQLSAEAEGKVLLNQSMMEGSRTGKAAEADLMVLIAKNPPVDGQEEEDTQRHLNVVKNKLTGWHGVVHCELDYKTARYTV
jgi:hypothetical protein